MADELGGKARESREMTRLGLPVPPGFTISTTACLPLLGENGTTPAQLAEQSQFRAWRS